VVSLVTETRKMGYIGCAEVRSASFEKYDANDAPPIVGTSYGTAVQIAKVHAPSEWQQKYADFSEQQLELLEAGQQAV